MGAIPRLPLRHRKFKNKKKTMEKEWDSIIEKSEIENINNLIKLRMN